jgi:plasmid maintenance system antidote protein VapI
LEAGKAKGITILMAVRLAKGFGLSPLEFIGLLLEDESGFIE